MTTLAQNSNVHRLNFLRDSITIDEEGKSVIDLEGVRELFNWMGLHNFNSMFIELKSPHSEIIENLTSENGLYNFTFQEIQSYLKNGFSDRFVGHLIHYLAFEEKNFRASQLVLHFNELSIRTIAHEVTGWKPTLRSEAIGYVLNQITSEAENWVLTYDPLFWAGLKRVFGYVQGQSGCAQTIAAIIYRWFPKEVYKKLNEVDAYNDKGYRPHKLHQFFTGEMKTSLDLRIKEVTLLLLTCDCTGDPKDYRKNFYKKLREKPEFLSHTKFLKGG